MRTGETNSKEYAGQISLVSHLHVETNQVMLESMHEHGRSPLSANRICVMVYTYTKHKYTTFCRCSFCCKTLSRKPQLRSFTRVNECPPLTTHNS